ncbi:MAG: hypothetical protein WAK16_04000 [Candidatus Cybelea sp.]
MSQLYKKTEYVTAMPAYRRNHPSDGDQPEVLEYAVQACDQNGEPLSTHLQFLSADTFKKEYAPVRRRPKPSKSKPPARVRTRPNNKEKLQTVRLNEVETNAQ